MQRSLRTIPDAITSRPIARTRFAALLAIGLWFPPAMLLSSHATVIGQETETKKPPQVVIPEQKPGEADFDKAIQLRLNVQTLEQLNEVIELIDSAIKKGLSAGSEESAKVFLASAYKQRVEISMRQLMQGPRNRATVSKLLGELLDDLTRSIELDPGLVESYLIKVAILRDRQEFGEALDVINAGIAEMEPRLERNAKSAAFRENLAKLYITRATLQDEPASQVADMEKAVETNPADPNIVKQLLALLESQQKFDRLLAVLDMALEYNPDALEFLLSKISVLLRLGKSEEAMAFSTQSIDQSTSDEVKAGLLRQRSLLHQVAGNKELAKADLDASLELAKDNIPSMLLRARLSVEMDNMEGAKKDIQAILDLDEQNADAILLRADIAAATEEFDAAISDYRSLIARVPAGTPQREELLMKLGLVFWQSNRHSQALRILDQVIQANDANWQAHRLQGEILLSQGEHADAVIAYEKALNLMPEAVSSEIRSSLLNNLSWLLATSPLDDVRDGNRSLELGLQACELTKYSQAHILSTLAAAYAEQGNFEKAIEFSEKAVELGRKDGNEQLEQLEEELKSYRDKKPWREKQEAKPEVKSEAKPKAAIPLPSGTGT
ncbi:Photosystem I assembly protein Ycf3 [Pirellula sp. SH-Sr6A]|uniref:tetratricopeptide repeat protein n=1 Tax=Pirellula sp. SH-Sr6A TaxID=1632865 RepID=UPI00078C513D|nr:tetratricopeptide repeat protein [Pirellula sp. SH-Sr6A]AMV33070.1 Photosystem I assembly protein Ycf3 [Pirellula sp. SH-Sr6A]